MDTHDLAKGLQTREQSTRALDQLPARFEAAEPRTPSVEGQVLDVRHDTSRAFSPTGHQHPTSDNGLFDVNLAVDRDGEAFHEPDARFDRLDVRMELMDERFDRIEARLNRIDQRLEKSEDEFAKMRKEIRLGDEETRRYMRVLHEDTIDRIAILRSELGGGSKPRRR
jgi:hypothetical protein